MASTLLNSLTKIPHMKSLRFFVLLLAGLTVLSCQDTKDHAASTTANQSYFKNVGHEIPFETGMRWLDLYQSKNSNGRLLQPEYSVSATQLNTLLNSVDDLTGVAFHYGLDDAGTRHIILIPINSTLSVWSSIPGRILVDANTGAPVDQDVAYEWAQRYQQANPDAIWFHYFGTGIFDDMNTIAYFNDIDIEPALSDLDLTPQLLLIVWNEQLLSAGRTQGDDNGRVYDASNPCPPCGVQ